MQQDADITSICRQQVQANKEQRTLTVSGRRAAPQLSDEQKQRRSRTERRFGTFQRVFKVRSSLFSVAWSACKPFTLAFPVPRLSAPRRRVASSSEPQLLLPPSCATATKSKA